MSQAEVQNNSSPKHDLPKEDSIIEEPEFKEYSPQKHKIQVQNQFIPSVGHPLQTNWQFWYFQRQISQQKLQYYYNNLSPADQKQHPLPFDHEKALLESSGDPNDSGEAFTVIKGDGKGSKGDKGHKKELSYRDQLMSLGQISTVEHFFNYYVYMKRPSHMPREIDLFFFRDGETPMWEDSPNGGIWISKIRKDDDIDKMWETILFALIGEQFEEPLVIGASLSLRTKERLLQIWLKDGRNDQLRVNISNKLRQLLQLDPSATTLYYKEHQKSIIDKSTMKNAEGFKFLQQKKEKEDKASSKADSSQKPLNVDKSDKKKDAPVLEYRPKQKDSGSGNKKEDPWSSMAGDSKKEQQAFRKNSHFKDGESSGQKQSSQQVEKVYRPKQKASNQQEQSLPFAGLAASNNSQNSSTGQKQDKVYRAKAPSHV